MSWYGIFGPPHTPQSIVDKVNAAIRTALAREDVRAQLKQGAVVPTTLDSPAAFARFVADDYHHWGKIIRESNIVSTPN